MISRDKEQIYAKGGQTMKIGLGQIDMGFEERERAMELCRAILAEAGEQGVDLTVFPDRLHTASEDLWRTAAWECIYCFLSGRSAEKQYGGLLWYACP